MAQRPRSIVIGSALLTALAAPACLPADTRPEPARVYIAADMPTALRDNQAADGSLRFMTDDGWSVTIASLYVSMGNAGFSGDGCNEYTGAGYRRVINVLQPGPQKVSQIWGLNACRLDYSLGVPRAGEGVVGQGVSTTELELMTNAIVPTSTPTGMTTVQGMALHIVGTAEKNGTRLEFDWGLSNGIRFTDCKRSVNGILEDHLPLVGGQTINLDILIDPRQLFSARAPSAGTLFIADPGSNSDAGNDGDAGLAAAKAGSGPDGGIPQDAAAPTTAPGQASAAPIALMQLMADADQVTGNANGHISIEELANTTIPGDPSILSKIPGATTNLAEALRQSSYPAMFIYGDGGQCSIDARQGGHRGRM